MTEKWVAVLGLGGIGGGVAHRLLGAGYQVRVYNRTADKARPLVAAGARPAPTPGSACANADVVVVSLSDERAVEQVIFGEVLADLRPGTILVDLTTVSPQFAQDAHQRLADRGIRRVEACVIGNPEMAQAGELRVFAAGDEADVEAVRDLLGTLGRHGVLRVGATGRASALKLAFNLLLGMQTVALAETVTFAEAAGLDRELLLTAIMKSGWRSPVLNFRAEFMRSRRYEPAAFRATLMAKDLNLAVGAAQGNGVTLPLAELTADRFAETVALGRGDKDAAVVLETPARPAGSAPAGKPAESAHAGMPGEANPWEYLRLGTAFCGSKILLTALELGLFQLLTTGGMTLEEIRTKLDLHPRGTRDFLDALVAFGLLTRSDGLYENTSGVARHLVPGEPGYVGGFLERANTMLYPAWGRFTEALRTGLPQSEFSEAEPYDGMSIDPDHLRSFLGMMDTMNGPLGKALAEAFPWRDYTSVVDVGGARGNLIASVARAHPHLTATVFDLPQVQPFFDEHMATLGLTGRIGFHPGSFFTDPLPNADVLVIGHVLHDWSPEQRQDLVRSAYRSVRDGGVLVVYDPMLDEDRPSALNLVISLDMLLTTAGGAEYRPSECRQWMVDAGFTDVTSSPLGFSDTMVVGRKVR